MSPMRDEGSWWQTAVIYQIYPWSFQDSNGDGIGDLPGIIRRLDYLSGTPDSLGVDAIWLTPIYPSPMHDFGYDVADYCAVDPRFGTLADFDHLVAEAHRRGIRVIMDLVLNHTSDQHPWFLASRASRASPKRDWYYWADPRGPGRRPSNWASRFGGSAWEWDAHTCQHYLHSFLPQQPDLNWHNPEVRRAMAEVVRFWLDRGIDGFRLDAINWLGKDTGWRDNPWRLGWRSYYRQRHLHDRDHPMTHEILRWVRTFLKDQPEIVLAGEASADTPGGPATFYGNGSDELHMVFDFRLLKSSWRAERFRQLIADGHRAVPSGGWPTVVFSNHDQPRHIDRYGSGGSAEQRARAAALLLFTLRGTPFVYYGEELGMRNGHLRYRDLRDPYTRRYWPFKKGRDPARTPMQWDTSPHAGFTTGAPWLPVSADFRSRNVAGEHHNPDSLLSLYRRLIRIRKESRALTLGNYQPVEGGPAECVIYRRTFRHPNGRSETMFVAVNFSSGPLTFSLPAVRQEGTVVLSTSSAVRPGLWSPDHVSLGPDEGILVQLKPT